MGAPMDEDKPAAAAGAATAGQAGAAAAASPPLPSQRSLRFLDALPAGIPVSYMPLYGAQGDGPAMCGLLRVGGATLLLDCGWDDRLDPSLLRPLLGEEEDEEGEGGGNDKKSSRRPAPSTRALIDTVDAVLLSHATPAHSGALPYLVGRKGMRAPVICTLPTARMAALAAYDALLSRQVREAEIFLFAF